MLLLADGGLQADAPPAEVLTPRPWPRYFGVRAEVRLDSDGRPLASIAHGGDVVTRGGSAIVAGRCWRCRPRRGRRRAGAAGGRDGRDRAAASPAATPREDQAAAASVSCPTTARAPTTTWAR